MELSIDPAHLGRGQGMTDLSKRTMIDVHSGVLQITTSWRHYLHPILLPIARYRYGAREGYASSVLLISPHPGFS